MFKEGRVASSPLRLEDQSDKTNQVNIEWLYSKGGAHTHLNVVLVRRHLMWK